MIYLYLIAKNTISNLNQFNIQKQVVSILIHNQNRYINFMPYGIYRCAK